jgi:hypothetical protein
MNHVFVVVSSSSSSSHSAIETVDVLVLMTSVFISKVISDTRTTVIAVIMLKIMIVIVIILIQAHSIVKVSIVDAAMIRRLVRAFIM